MFWRLPSVLGVSARLTDSRHGSLSFKENRLGIGMFSCNLQPGCDNGRERASSGKDDRAPVIASSHSAPVLYPAEAILDSMASLVEFGVVVDFILSSFPLLLQTVCRHFHGITARQSNQRKSFRTRAKTFAGMRERG